MSAAFKAIWNEFVIAVLANVTGVQGIIAKYALNYGGQYLYDLFNKWVKDHERAKQQEAARKEYESKQADPKSTVEERAKAYEETINAGR